MKHTIALIVAAAIGYFSQKFGVPIPAPPTLFGVAMILAITVGYMIAAKGY